MKNTSLPDQDNQKKRTVFQRVFDLFEGTVDEIIDEIQGFLRLEAAAGILLVIAAAIAMIIANTDLSSIYNYFLNQLHFKIGFIDHAQNMKFAIDKPIVLWINDGLMAVFFFLVGLEIKREVVQGELSSPERLILPLFAAIGGVVVPAGIFYLINQDYPNYLGGWAIPMATDIAFALGILALLGSRVPVALKILLTAVAIVDDLIAILTIALFYSKSIDVTALYYAAVFFVGLVMLNRSKVSKITPYILIGTLMWVAVLKSGVHATLAGVVTALFIPISCMKSTDHSPLKHLEHSLHPWVAYMILPVFAFANAGVSFDGLSIDSLKEPLTLGIILGLFVGKQLGIFIPLALTIILKLSPKPKNVGWVHLYGMSVLCGVGFTMSLFIGGLAFDTQDNADAVKLGILTASLLSGVFGYCILRFFGNIDRKEQEKGIIKDV